MTDISVPTRVIVSTAALATLTTGIVMVEGFAGVGEAADQPPLTWPWEAAAWKQGGPRTMLVKAVALAWAAIDRLDAGDAR